MFYSALLGLLVANAASLVVVFMKLSLSIRRYSYRTDEADGMARESDLPTVSVCVPARNEMHAMTACLERLVASDYPKLEMIVLDDSSVDDTSVLIKSFAHAGVRFVEGGPLESGWLGKNNALEGLLHEASGQYILFLDVDVILEPNSIRKLVRYAQARQTPLLSVVPQRVDGLRASVFLGTLRYLWLLVFDKKSLPSVNASAWLVERKELIRQGGFTRCRNNPLAEQALAMSMMAPYGSQLLLSSAELGVSYEKKWTSQVESSVRLLRPNIGSWIGSVLVAITILAMAILPLLGLVVGLLGEDAVLTTASMAGIILMTLISLRYYHTVWRHGWWLGALHWPYVLIQEAILVLLSAGRHRTGTVTWKGRAILQSD